MECKTEFNAFNEERGVHGAYPGMWQYEFASTKESQGTGLRNVEVRKWLTLLVGPCGPFGHPSDSRNVVGIPKEAIENQH
jgi:hypothetical protein